MNDQDSRIRDGIPTWAILVIAIAALVLATAALMATLVRPSGFGIMSGGGMMSGSGMMFPSGPAAAMMGRQGVLDGPGPGVAGFVAGTMAAPRLISVLAGAGYSFSPSTITVARGETVTFVVTSMGPLVHEFMVGPADAVAADAPGTPEVADIVMMASKSLTYTFDGAGPFAFACHADGHYEAGMRGIITLVD